MEQRRREAREKEEEIESESERGRGNEIVKGRRRSAGQNERQRREGGEGKRETGCPGPPGQTIAAR